MDAAVQKTLLPLDDAGLDLIFREARTFNAFTDTPVADETLTEAVRLAELGPTGVNAVPGRFLFLRSPEAKARLLPALSEGNKEKTAKAPVTVIVAHDIAFTETLATTFPHAPGAKDWFQGQAAVDYAAYNATLQAAYLIVALRALGLDTGPMGGFDKGAVDAAFFEGTTWRSNLLVNVGYGDRSALRPRGPRLGVEAITRFL
ncbi:malonic semialdehyde reductase [Mongoliimonas terrestris]|uniref:malonic semialdehyde reductase n=1 Tax=Mongoliimonas terrestris TaxID=1709001 RepID=UPI00094955CE|nr:malonic semialdehyde reductase [Mongoliimonas terrestris]